MFGFNYGHLGFTYLRGGTWGEEKFGLSLSHPQYYVDPDSLKDFQLYQEWKMDQIIERRRKGVSHARRKTPLRKKADQYEKVTQFQQEGSGNLIGALN